MQSWKQSLLTLPGVKPAWRGFTAQRRRAFERLGDFRYSRPGMAGLDKYLDFRDGSFIEVGGHDGYTQSNTYYLEKALGWRGVLVEGIPELYEQCKRNRPNSRVFNCALVSSDFKDETVEMHYASLMSVVEGSLKSGEAQSAHVQTGLAHQQLAQTYAVRVPARTLESVLDEAGAPVIDFFSLDVEGYELPVLQGMNLARYAPTYILVEARFFNEVDALLAPRYAQVAQLWEHDYLYRKRKRDA